jgi:hypothetical protein
MGASHLPLSRRKSPFSFKKLQRILTSPTVRKAKEKKVPNSQAPNSPQPPLHSIRQFLHQFKTKTSKLNSPNGTDVQSGEGERECVAMAERTGIHATAMQWNAKAALGTERGESQPKEEKEDSGGRSRFRGRSSRQRSGCKGRLGLITPRHWSDPPLEACQTIRVWITKYVTSKKASQIDLKL